MIALPAALLVLGVLGFLVWTAARSSLDQLGRDAIDPAEAARSAAVAVGLYLAMLAIAVGFIDLFQAIAGGDRVAGSSSDLARSISLLVVGTPVFALLYRFVEQRRREDQRIGLGWSAHLVASLTTTLFGVLVSVTQIAEGFSRSDVRSSEVAQLLGWLVVWLAYWFVLRHRSGVLGAIHLGLGTIAGLGWLVAGVIGASNAVLSDAYESVFDVVLVAEHPVRGWLLAAGAGLVAWLWHWYHLNGDRGVEGATRRGPTWYVTVVAGVIVPAVIALLVLGYLSISGVLIWFLGTTDESAADYFDPAPGFVAGGLVALAAWAFHRWELLRDGDPDRNDSLRFHDYAVAAVGLIAVVTGVALVVGLVFETLTAGRTIADAFETDNRLITTVTLLALAAPLWWWIWGRIEASRRGLPVAECSSVWRKLYLTLAAGLGGLVLAVSTIWVLFVTLRDLFDGVLGESTLGDLAGPIGWGIAVLGGAWYHAGVWRSDRAVLAAVAPPPPTEAQTAASLPPAPPPPVPPDPAPPLPPLPATPAQPPMHFRWAAEDDHGELFSLQRAAFVDEAMAYDTPDVPPLRESLERFSERTGELETLVLVDKARIIGAVSLREHGGLPWLERLMVAPDRRREHLGTQIVRRIEDHAREHGHETLRVVVGDRDPELLGFYDRLGYETIGRTAATNGTPSLLVLERRLGAA